MLSSSLKAKYSASGAKNTVALHLREAVDGSPVQVVPAFDMPLMVPAA